MTPRDAPRDPRTRTVWKLTGLVAIVFGVGLAALLGASGRSGRTGAAGFLLGVAFACVVASLYGTVTAVVDLARGHHVGASRAVSVGVLFVLVVLLTAMVAGIGG